MINMNDIFSEIKVRPFDGSMEPPIEKMVPKLEKQD